MTTNEKYNAEGTKENMHRGRVGYSVAHAGES